MEDVSCYDVAVERKGLPDFPEDETVYIPVVVHEKPDSGCIIISYPGYGSNADGYLNKWEKLAHFMQERIGAVIRMPNINHGDTAEHYRESVKADLRAVIKYALENAQMLCGAKDPDIFLFGYSAGASAIAAVACDYDNVKKILLVAPSLDAGKVEVETGIALFNGHVYILAADEDRIVRNNPMNLYESAVSAISSVIRKVPNCDHQFKGTKNGIALCGSTLWAFKLNGRFPKQEECIELY